ncbi:hypothetical protein GCM10010358_33900 [Streptomyces minutiscleroticus]|uniref:Uncharacterized protein n=1 Tax=Streptomyces minutiscleroticus TaxID=68238 RepID=A0A918NIV9_9ACTN|nr:hypothetical protein GCM10010358_33900 [Streptomyces minutiscleroticus]
MPGGKRGERAGCGRWGFRFIGPVGPSSADALSKYENSGAHGTDPPPGTHRLSSGWDGSLIM